MSSFFSKSSPSPAAAGKSAGANTAGGGDDPKNLPELPLPPKCIRMVLFDMDQTLLSTHTGGCFRGRLEDLALKVVPAFVSLVPKLIANGFLVGIVTFSDALMKGSATNIGWAGESLVTELLLVTFQQYFAQTLPMATKPQTAKLAADVVAAIPIAAAFPQLRNTQPAFQKPYLPMPNSKYWHIEQVKAAIAARKPPAAATATATAASASAAPAAACGELLQNEQLMLFDDSEPNVKEAAITRVHAFGVDRKVGFTAKDWCDAVAIVRARELNPALPITAVGVGHGPKGGAPKSFGGGSGPGGGGAAPSVGLPSLTIGSGPTLSTPKARGPPTPHPPNQNLSLHQPPQLLISPRFSVTDGANSSTSTIHSLPPTPHSGSSVPYGTQQSGPTALGVGVSSGVAAALNSAAAAAMVSPTLSNIHEHVDARSGSANVTVALIPPTPANSAAALNAAAAAAFAAAMNNSNAAILAASSSAASGSGSAASVGSAAGGGAGGAGPAGDDLLMASSDPNDPTYSALIGTGTILPPSGGGALLAGTGGAAGTGSGGGSVGFIGTRAPPHVNLKSSSSVAASPQQLSPRVEYRHSASGVPPTGSLLTPAAAAGDHGGAANGVRSLRPSSASLSSGPPQQRSSSIVSQSPLYSISPPSTASSASLAAANAAWASVASPPLPAASSPTASSAASAAAAASSSSAANFNSNSSVGSTGSTGTGSGSGFGAAYGYSGPRPLIVPSPASTGTVTAASSSSNVTHGTGLSCVGGAGTGGGGGTFTSPLSPMASQMDRLTSALLSASHAASTYPSNP